MSSWLPGGAEAPGRRRVRSRFGFPPGTAAFVSAAPDFGLAAVFLATWIRPTAMPDDMLPRLTILMALEFIVVHSAGFMGFIVHDGESRGRRTLWMLGLIGVYSIFALGFSLAAHAWWPLISFTILGLNRTSAIWTGQSRGRDLGPFIIRGWVLPTVLYLGGVLFTAAGPIPRLGITDAIVAMHRGGGVSGLWTDEPWRVLALGGFYFAAVGLTELFDPGAGGEPVAAEVV
jgi:hypothetical protein